MHDLFREHATVLVSNGRLLSPYLYEQPAG